MSIIGTHDSATGEPGRGLLSALLSPFATTQRLNLIEQYQAGCRYFDLRLRHGKHGKLVFAHGLWESESNASLRLTDLQVSASTDNEIVYVMITYEGVCEDEDKWIKEATDLISGHTNLRLTEINIKKPIWKCLWRSPEAPPYRQGYKNLDGSTWHTYIPIPWLWNKVFGSLRVRKEGDPEVIFIDFL